MRNGSERADVLRDVTSHEYAQGALETGNRKPGALNPNRVTQRYPYASAQVMLFSRLDLREKTTA